MTTQQLLIAAAVLAVIGLLTVFNSGRRHAARSLDGMRRVTRLGGTAFRAVFTAAVIVGIEWFVVAKFADNTGLLLGVLAVPALFAGASIARLLAVTEVVHTDRWGGGRR